MARINSFIWLISASTLEIYSQMGQHWSKQYYLGRNLCSCGACTDYQTQKGFLWNSKSFLSPIDLVKISTTLLRLGTITRWGAPIWRGCESPTSSVSLGTSDITREVTSPDWSWFYEADGERESFVKENKDIPNWETLGNWVLCMSWF